MLELSLPSAVSSFLMSSGSELSPQVIVPR